MAEIPPAIDSVAVAVDGGVAFFPGLAAPRTVDAAKLPANDRAALGKLVGDAKFFARDEPPRARGADRRTYIVTVTAGGKTRELRVAEPVTDPALKALIDKAQELAAPR